jgi:hypothetical protein
LQARCLLPPAGDLVVHLLAHLVVATRGQQHAWNRLRVCDVDVHFEQQSPFFSAVPANILICDWSSCATSDCSCTASD